MNNNFYFLRQLSPALGRAIAGYTLVSCFSQNKEELILEFNNARTSFFLKASLTSSFSCLSFPFSVHRARKNTVDLFPSVIMKKVIVVRQYENERSFSIELEGGRVLLFKMHGNRANVVLFGEEGVVEIFRNHLTADREINSETLDRTIDWSFAYFEAHQHEIRDIYFTFGKDIWSYLDSHGFETADTNHRWELLTETREKLEAPEYYILQQKDRIMFSLLPGTDPLYQSQNPVEAITTFYGQFVTTQALHLERSAALRAIETQLAAGEGYLEKTRRKLQDLVPDIHYQQWADLIMANMNRITAGMDRIVVEDFYNNNAPVEIRLKKEINAQRNAEVYYRKAKNQQVEIRKLSEAIDAKEKEIRELKEKKVFIKNEPELSKLRKRLEETGRRRHTKSEVIVLPYHEFEYKDFLIWIGKNALANDTLTLKFSHKEDLWLHAKDVAGSHVLLKFQAGKPFPKDVIERAAELAAWHSKRRNDSLCPVAVTPKKFVRKRKGAPAGSVVVDREETLLVVPRGT